MSEKQTTKKAATMTDTEKDELERLRKQFKEDRKTVSRLTHYRDYTRALVLALGNEIVELRLALAERTAERDEARLYSNVNP